MAYMVRSSPASAPSFNLQLPLGIGVQGEPRILDGMPIDLALQDWAGDASQTSWVQLALEGKWSGHWMGPFSLTGQMFDQMVQHFDAATVDTVVDYEHATVFADEAPAAGWVKAVERRGGGEGRANELWGQVEWTERAAGMIRAREYRYLSPTITFNTKDRKTGQLTGASLHSVALTNKPFLQELPEVRLNSLRRALLGSQLSEEESMNREQFLALCAALGLDPSTTTSEQAIAAACASVENTAALAGVVMGVRTTLGLAEDTDVVTAVGDLHTAANASGNALAAEVQLLRTQVQAMADREAQANARALVGEMQAQGRVLGEGTPNYDAALTMAQQDPERFRALMETVPAFSVAPRTAPVQHGVQLRQLPSGADPGWYNPDDPDFQAACSQVGLTADEVKTLGEITDPSTLLFPASRSPETPEGN
jgi:phage I-like protein